MSTDKYLKLSLIPTTTDNIWLKLSVIYHKLVTDHYYSLYIYIYNIFLVLVLVVFWTVVDV